VKEYVGIFIHNSRGVIKKNHNDTDHQQGEFKYWPVKFEPDGQVSTTKRGQTSKCLGHVMRKH